MNTTWIGRRGAALAAGLLAGAIALAATPAAAGPWSGDRERFRDDRFARVWARTDAPEVRGGRSWYWGPSPWFDYAEFYREGQQGLRTVQYFDKARMEINNPGDTSGASRGVTNGLLVKELVSGRLQLGNNPFDIDQYNPADVPVAGNPRAANPAAPGYASFVGVATIDNSYRDPQRLGERVAATIDRGGTIGLRPDLARPETEIVQYSSVTGHNIPRVFWEYMNLQGRFQEDGQTRSGQVVDWLFAMGLPITDAYWTRARIGDTEQDVLVQLFERRVLTYVPGNPAGFQVEMGNVGQHYFQWRYPHLGQPWASSPPVTPLLYASDRDTAGAHWELYSGDYRVTRGVEETVASSWRRSWDPGLMRLLVDSRRSNPSYRQIYEFDPPAYYSGDDAANAGVRRVTYSDGTMPPPEGPYPGWLPSGAASEFNAAYSPDGSKILYVSDRSGAPELHLMLARGDGSIALTSQGCANESPTWGPDGRQIYWVSNCDGDFDIYRADLAYSYDGRFYVEARLANVTNLTNNGADDRYARVSPDGRQIAYSSNSDGDYEVYMASTVDGRVLRQVTANGASDEAPTWSGDGRQIAYASDQDGDYEIYLYTLDTGEVRRATDNSAQDRWPLWAQ